MKVYRADTGEAYDVGSSPNSTVASVKAELASLAGVEAADQILLFDRYKLDDANTLAAYHLPAEDKPVFLFNRKQLMPGTPAPKETVLGPIETRVPPETAAPNATGLVGTLLKYQHQFLGHLNFAKAVLVAVDSRIAMSRHCCAEQDMQAKALDVAVAHLNEQYRQVPPSFEAFNEYYQRQKSKHENLLESFETDLAKLREMTLHPALRNGGMQTLMDVVSEARLRKWAEDCQKGNEQLRLRLEEVEHQIVSTQREIDSLAAGFEVNLEGLKEGLKNTGPLRQEVASTKASFSKDYKSVTATIEDLHRGKGEGGSWEICDGFDSMKTVHLKQLDRLTKIDLASAKVLTACAESKHVAILEARVRDIINKFLVLREALTRQQQAFAQLFYVRYLPDAYHAALDEVVRRKAFGKQLAALFTQFAQRLARIRDDEIKQRDAFLTKHGRYIPKNLIPGLPDELPDFVSAFVGRAFPVALDRNLPAIEPQVDSAHAAPPLMNLNSELGVSPPKSSPPTELSGRLGALEAENARLVAEIQGLRREREQQKQKTPMKTPSREREREDEAAAMYRSPYSSPAASSSSSLASPSSSMTGLSGAERKRVEESYQQRILSLEEKLTETYRQASLAEQTREAAEKKVAVAEREMRMMREALALMEGKLKDWEAARKPPAAAHGADAGFGGSADVGFGGNNSSGSVDVSAERAAMKALRVECEDLRERLNKLSEENRLLVSNLHETHETLMEEKGRQKRRDEELEAAAHDGAELRERVSALERRKIALEEELEAAKRSGADSVEAHERALEECRRREAALEADVREALERLDLTARERDDLRTQIAALKDELERAQAVLVEREKAEREIVQKLAQVEAEKEALLQEQKATAQLTEEQSQQLAKSLSKARAEREARKKAAMDVLAQYDMEKGKSLSASTALAIADLASPTSSATFGLSESPTSSSTFTPGRSGIPMRRERSGPLGDEIGRQELLAEANRASQLVEEEQASMAKSISQLEERTRVLQQTLSMREKELESKIGEQVEKEAEVTHLRVALEEEKELLHRSLLEKDLQVQDKQLQITRLEDYIRAKEEEIARLTQARNEEGELQIARLEDYIRAKEEEIVRLTQALDEEREQRQAIAEQKEALEAEMAVRQHDGKTEAEELSKTLAGLHGQLDIKDRNIATLLESNKAKEFLLGDLNDRLKEVTKQMNELEESLTTNKKELEDFRNLEQTLELLRQESEQTKKALEEKIAELTASKQRMLALSDFKVDDLMCFEFDSSAGRYEAFNRGAPNYFLSEESRELFREQHRTRRDHIIGQVVFIMEFVARTPYRLPINTRFYEVTITKIETEAAQP
ncbi:ubiquitin domain containing protein [Acanthamoeba castellanii str. Neff]|uniref:Ubiquitin domain containing protein n=1 Tax=Acanthamoeba castellanii (strain ATCC 30010 / Neff) TaxID=1257118 RepID=L8GVQ2_ACACF|nr:ubiquitin domain containing protein [Acanthamoeba castellanii str. Neff]ELR16141.1 ubiquitin domain containing protein [Acanthamoeba castellanii str. Neff]